MRQVRGSAGVVEWPRRASKTAQGAIRPRAVWLCMFVRIPTGCIIPMYAWRMTVFLSIHLNIFVNISIGKVLIEGLKHHSHT